MLTPRSPMSAMFALTLVLTAAPAFADPPKATEPGPWKFGTTVGLNLSQSAFSSNWAGGDRGSLVWVFNSQSSAERQFTTRFNWSNTLKLAYGQTAKQVAGTTPTDLRWQSPDKTTDVIAFGTLGRWTLGGPLDPYVAFDAESQFRDQTDPRGRIPLNPIKLKQSAGAARLLFKTDDGEGLTRVGFAFREVLARTFVDPLGTQKRRSTSTDGGIEWQTTVMRPLSGKKILYKGSLLVYQPLFYSKSGDLETVDATLRAADPGRESVADFWKTTDLNLQNTFTAQVTKSIGVALDVQYVYDKFDAAALVDPALATSADPAVRSTYTAQLDKNVRKAGQFREVLALAITYRLF